ncbi:MAG: site-specific integrase [Bacteroidales bacterium]
MKKKAVKNKELCRIRFQELRGGNQSIYLDTYVKGRRERQFLKLYLVPERSLFDKEQNARTLALANEIKSQRVIDMQRQMHNLAPLQSKKHVRLIDYIRYVASNKRALATQTGYKTLAIYLSKFRSDVSLEQIDKQFIVEFFEFLKRMRCVHTHKNEAGTHNALSENSRVHCCRLLKAVLKTAMQEELIVRNPFDSLSRDLLPRLQQIEIPFLSVEEVNRIKDVHTKFSDVKAAYLFSCYTGLRFSDIQALAWGNVRETDSQTMLIYVQKKTKKQHYLPLPRPALEILEDKERSSDDAKVFTLPSAAYINVALRSIAAAAGVGGKKVTFHTARHTCATLLLSKGVSIEVISKILAHSNISTTQIYAKVLSKEVEEGMHQLDTL